MKLRQGFPCHKAVQDSLPFPGPQELRLHHAFRQGPLLRDTPGLVRRLEQPCIYRVSIMQRPISFEAGGRQDCQLNGR